MSKTAKTVPAYGMRPVGGFGIRGFRAHCPECGSLSKLHENVMAANRAAERHRCDG